MMKCFVSAALFFVFFQCYSQESWVKVFDRPGLDSGSDMIMLQDSSIVVVGSSSDGGNGLTDGSITRISDSGEIIWANSYGTLNVDEFNGVTLDDDGALSVIGTSLSIETGSYNVTFTKWGQDGQLIVEKIWQSTPWRFGGKIIQMPDGGYAAIVNKLSADTGLYSGELLFLDDDYDLVSQVNGQTTSELFFNDIRLSGTNEVIVCGTEIDDLNVSHAVVYTWTSEGEALWNESYDSAAGSGFNAVDTYPDGRLALVGFLINEDNGYKDFYMALVDVDGELVWDYTIDGNDQVSYQFDDEFYDVVVKTNDRICASGSTFRGSNLFEDEVVVLQRTVNNFFVSIQIYGDVQQDVGSAIISTANSGHIVLAETDSYGFENQNIMLIKALPPGGVENDIPEIIQVSGFNTILSNDQRLASSVNWFVNEQKVLTSAGAYIEACAIVDLTGKEVWSAKNEWATVLDLPELNGMYVLRVQLASQDWSPAKLVFFTP